MTKKFRSWLLNYCGQDTVYGDVAMCVSIDKTTKTLHDNKQMWMDHVSPLGFGNAVELLSELFDMFERGELPPQKIKKHKVWIDDSWIISAPTVPNYLFQKKCICRVFPSSKSAISDFEINSEKRYKYITVAGEAYGSAVEQLGCYFRREFHYDFLPYTWEGHKKSEYNKKGKIDAYLFIDNGYDISAHAIGACGFFLPAGGSRWVMNFVYFHPAARRRGFLSSAWKMFQAIYGDFLTEYPISDSMESFLNKRGELNRHAEHWVQSEVKNATQEK